MPATSLRRPCQACATASLLYLPYWGSLPAEEQAAPRHSWLCAGLLLAAVLFAVVRSQLFFHIAVTASDKLHRCALQRLLRAPMVFYDSNPSGRLLNRFSKDIEFCDSMLPQTFHDTMQCVLMVTASVGLCIALAPWALIALPPLLSHARHIRRGLTHAEASKDGWGARDFDLGGLGNCLAVFGRGGSGNSNGATTTGGGVGGGGATGCVALVLQHMLPIPFAAVGDGVHFHARHMQKI